MAEVANLINATDLLNNLESSILDKLAPLMTIFKAVGIAILVYVLFLIIRALFKWRTMHKVVKIAKSVEEISQKLDIISAKLTVKEKAEEKVEKGKDKKVKNKKEKKGKK